MRALLLAGLLLALPVPPCLGQTASPAEVMAPGAEAHRLAAEVREKIQAPAMMRTLLGQTRQSVVVLFEKYGKTQAHSEEIFGEFMLPEFRAPSPELLQTFEDILVQDFTVDELQAVVNDESGPARASAAAKGPRLPPEFEAAGGTWGRRVATDVYNKNVTTLKKLGLDLESPPT